MILIFDTVSIVTLVVVVSHIFSGIKIYTNIDLIGEYLPANIGKAPPPHILRICPNITATFHQVVRYGHCGRLGVLTFYVVIVYILK